MIQFNTLKKIQKHGQVEAKEIFSSQVVDEKNLYKQDDQHAQHLIPGLIADHVRSNGNQGLM